MTAASIDNSTGYELSPIRNKKKPARKIVKKKDPHQSLKNAIWIYFLLLIFEGALRKWFLPALATPLLLVRDPIAMWAMYKASSLKIFPRNNYIPVIVTVGVISIFTAVATGHGNILVAFYGARPFLFYVPFMFIMERILVREDIIKIGKVTLWLSIMMTVLIALQFYSPQSAWVNRGVGGDEAGAGFSGALGYQRPPGTFSFTNGTTLFYSFLSGYVLYFWLNPDSVNRWLLLASTGALLASIPLSISRTLMFSVGVTVVFIVLAIARKPKYIGKMMGASVGLVIVIMALSQTEFFNTAMRALTARIETANEQSEGGDLQSSIVDRYLGGITVPFRHIGDMPFLGYGSGMLTSVGSKLLSGKVVSGISEGEFARLMSELGLVMGIIIIIARTGILIDIIKKSYQKLKAGDLLPWALLSFAVLQGPQCNWAQPTSLGFSVFGVGLALAACKKRYKRKPVTIA
ncbi:hypothetical protein HH214_14290 [Mucilaginibacter robiniae]|uniref:O-antigen ligase domain-containing protein n=1 Tax=Mucilaginibacter robiniae TaxID=2728022 RepID=A0A7L5E7W7_9SPHI|nr:hypothetical protein [Mucilaginibacter robiniae]QJD96953.1 hypothetical protein HH214_14290 [Mucilaginibacter robiniae]